MTLKRLDAGVDVRVLLQARRCCKGFAAFRTGMAASAYVLRADVALKVGRIGKYLGTVLAGIFSYICVRKSSVSQQKCAGAIRAVAEFTMKSSSWLRVLLYQVVIKSVNIRIRSVTEITPRFSVLSLLFFNLRKRTELLRTQWPLRRSNNILKR